MSGPVSILFASGPLPLIAATIAHFRPDVVVSEFAYDGVEWIPYNPHRSIEDNRALVLAKLGGRTMERAAVILPGAGMSDLARSLCTCAVYDDTGLTTESQHTRRKWKRSVQQRLQAIARLARPGELQLSLLYRRALQHGAALTRPATAPQPARESPPGISVVIPSRSGRELLARCLPGIQDADEIIVVDNGSDDGTAEWLGREHPRVILEHSAEPLAFAVAMNRGLRRARYSHVCALNNDMVVEVGFLAALRAAFDAVPDLFCSSAQIFLPPGQRREETGKTVFVHHPAPTDLPLRCDVPLEGEDQTCVLYGSGGCSLYDAAKLAALGGFDQTYTPAYVEDLDLGVRAWALGWPSVYCAGARVLHQHRTTTSRHYTPAQLEFALDRNYTSFLVRAVGDQEWFQRLWQDNALRLKALGRAEALLHAVQIPASPVLTGDYRFLDLVNGDVAVFPGRAATGKPVVLIASPYLPFPLSHGAAVRIYNLVREAAPDFDVVLVAFVEDPRPVPRELLALCVEVVTVHRRGMHAPPSRGRPDTVEEFDSPAFHAALRHAMHKWKPGIAQLEFTQMAIYAEDVRPTRTILVEHDITYDLYAQLLARAEDWETRRQHDLWRSFERAAWQQVDQVVTMSEKDRAIVGERALAIGNGVDLERFQPSSEAPEPRRLLFIGSFAHKPNVLALEFFLGEVMPLLHDVTLHVIAGQNHTRFWDLQHQRVEVDGFVPDVRPAYRRAAVVIAPLVASAGTNVKIVEAMAVGRAIVSTQAGIHGLDLTPGADVLVEDDPAKMAAAITRVLESPAERIALEQHARQTAERVYGWRAMGEIQRRLYGG